MLLKCTNYNVNGLIQSPKRKSIFYLLKQKQYDIVFLQQTHCEFTDKTLWTCEWGGNIVFAHGKNNSRGVAILLKYSLKFEMGTINTHSEGKFILVEEKINNKTLVLKSVYAPIIDEPKFFDSLFSAIADYSDNDLIIGWDWNLVLNNRLDKDGGLPH